MTIDYVDSLAHSIRFADNVPDLFQRKGLIFYETDYRRDTIGTTRHSYLDWFLIPEERYSIDPPEVKETYVDVPGANGALDYSEALTLYPTYKDIEGSMSFIIDNERRIWYDQIQKRDMFWNIIYNDIKTYLHGRTRYMILEDNPGWYYQGRFTVGKYDAREKNYSKIVISYKLKPFRMMPWLSDDNYWDTIDLQGGYEDFEKFDLCQNHIHGIEINSPNDWVQNPWPGDDQTPWGMRIKCGIMPVVPTFTARRLDNNPVNITLRFWNEHIGIMSHEFTITDPGDSYNDTVGVKYVDRQTIFTNMALPTKDESTNLWSTDFALDVKGVGKLDIDYDIGVL